VNTLSARRLADEFGPKSAVAAQAVGELYTALRSVAADRVERWQTLFEATSGSGHDLQRLAAAAAPERFDLADAAKHPGAVLFALQTYFALVVEHLATTISRGDVTALLAEDLFRWPLAVASAPLREAVETIADRQAGYDLAQLADDPAEGHDLLRPLYEELFPRPLRHAQGEYYTPGWLVDLVLDEAGYQGDPQQRLLDPTCGSGGFLLRAIARMNRRCTARGEPAPRLAEILHNVVGFELSPLAVLTARVNYLLAIRRLLPEGRAVRLPIERRDVLLDSPPAVADFDYVVGNPPWVAWDHLPPSYRRATLSQWQGYGLFSLSGNEGRHGGAKKDLSMLVTYAAADRYLRSGGRLAFVISQTLLQTKGAGDGFRRFRLGPEGAFLKILRVNDLVALHPFPQAATCTATLTLEKGLPTEYPVQYVKWTPTAPTGARSAIAAPPAECCECQAEPVDGRKPGSPWIIAPAGWTRAWSTLLGPSDYRAYLGANTGGANGVYWLEILAAESDRLRVRNEAALGKSGLPAVEAWIEPDLVYPLLRWGDLRRYRAAPCGHLLLVQDPQTRRGLEEPELARRYPQTFAYLNHFRPNLLQRAAYRRYQQRGAFYSMYNVGPYTLAPIKVVWRRMTRRIEAAVVETHIAAPLGSRPVIPQETCVLLPADSTDEAYYLCALLNSGPAGFLVQSYSVAGGKGFGTPGILEFLPIGRYDAGNPLHQELSGCGRRCQQLAFEAADISAFETQIDRLVGQLWKLSERELELARNP
jgi:hypothetical protein